MTDQRQGGFGTKFRIMISGVMTDVIYAQDIGNLSLKKFIADMTGHDAPYGFAEKIDTGKREVQSFDVKLTWDPGESSHAALSTAFASRHSVQTEWEDAAGLETIGLMVLIEQLTRSTPQENAYTCTAKITPTGVPTGIAVGSGSGGTP
jgi:hypothetical protein